MTCVYCKQKCYNDCKEAKREHKKAYREANKEAIKEYDKAYYEENKEAVKERSKARYEANKEAVKARRKAYYEENKSEHIVRVRARKKNMTLRTFAHERERLNSFYEYAATLRRDLPDHKYVVDHIIPLSHPLVSGLHVIANMQLIPSSVNDSKSNKWDGTYDNRDWASASV